LQQLFGWRPLDHHHHHNTHHHGQEEGFHDPREEEEVEDPAEEEGCRGAEEGAGEESCREAEGHLRAMRHQEGHRERQRGRAQEDCQGVLRQVVQLGGRNVLPPERGHPQGPANQRAQHVRLRHEGQVHQAHPQEGLQVREQVRQAPRKGCQVRVREPAQSQGQVTRLPCWPRHKTRTTYTSEYFTVYQCTIAVLLAVPHPSQLLQTTQIRKDKLSQDTRAKNMETTRRNSHRGRA